MPIIPILVKIGEVILATYITKKAIETSNDIRELITKSNSFEGSNADGGSNVLIFPEKEQLTDDGDVLTFDPPNVDLDSEVLDLGEPIGFNDNTFFPKGDGFLDDLLNGRFETPNQGEEGTYYLASEINGNISDDQWDDIDEFNDPSISVSPEAKAIANGHGYAKHRNQFPGVETRDDYAELIDSIINTVPKENIRDDLANGRKAYWDDATGTLVITDPVDIDGGTAYKPDKGKEDFSNLK